jgi:hypothetical protein
VAADHGDAGGGAGAEDGDGQGGGVGHKWNCSGDRRGVNLCGEWFALEGPAHVGGGGGGYGMAASQGEGGGG